MKCKSTIALIAHIVFYNCVQEGLTAIYTYEDVELRRIFPNEFPQDTIRKSGSLDPEVQLTTEVVSGLLSLQLNVKPGFNIHTFHVNNKYIIRDHLGRYAEIKSYFKHPKIKVNSHFEELACYDENGKKVCKLAEERYSPEEKNYYWSNDHVSHVDRRRVYCLMLLCFTEDELDRVVASF